MDGHILTPDNFKDFALEIVQRNKRREYTTTDHLIAHVKVALETGDQVDCLYISLDNSVRANQSGFRLWERLPGICGLINTINAELGGNCLVFFSEACRPSFSGTRENRQDIKPWAEIVAYMESAVSGSKMLLALPNNTLSDMAFGVALLKCGDAVPEIKTLHERNILPIEPSRGYQGCACIGIEFACSGEIVWGLHFPINFQMPQQSAETMRNLCALMESTNSILAFGDFNIVPGELQDAVVDNVPLEMLLYTPLFPTFFGSFFDSIENVESEERKSIKHWTLDDGLYSKQCRSHY